MKTWRFFSAVSHQTVIAIDRKRSYEELKDSERRYRLLFNQSNDAIILSDRDGRILDANHRAFKMLGYTVNQLKHQSISDLHPETEIGKVKRAMEKNHSQGTDYL